MELPFSDLRDTAECLTGGRSGVSNSDRKIELATGLTEIGGGEHRDAIARRRASRERAIIFRDQNLSAYPALRRESENAHRSCLSAARASIWEGRPSRTVCFLQSWGTTIRMASSRLNPARPILAGGIFTSPSWGIFYEQLVGGEAFLESRCRDQL